MSLSARFHEFERRSALALAEAIVPGSRWVPAADEATIARADAVVRHMDDRLAGAWHAAQAALSAAAVAQTGRPFHALSAEAQDRLLRRWESDPLLRAPLGIVALVYKFVHFDHKPVYEGMGGKLHVVSSLEQPRWLEQIHRADAWQGGDEIEAEVVVVGTGAGGAVVGKELADRGFAVVFLEEGEHHRRDAFNGSSINAHQRFFRFAMSLGNAAIPIFIGRLVGGSTAINTGTCFRTPPWVLERWCEELSTDEFEPGKMAAWFEQVERTLQVAPAERRIIGPIADVMARGCDALGWAHGPAMRNAPDCDGSGFCDFGCPTDARRGTHLSYIPPALERGAVLLTGARADRVMLEQGRAVGVEAVSKTGRRLRVRAPTVVLAGGAIPTPLFLLGQGLANRSGQVGRNLSVHPSGGLLALYDDEIRGWAHAPQGYVSEQFLKDGILVLAAQPGFNTAGIVFPFSGRRLMETLDQFDHVAGFGVLVRDASANGRVWRDVGGVPAISYNVGGEDLERMHRGLVHTGEMALAGGARKIFPVVLGMGPLEGRAGLETLRRTRLAAKDVAWTSYHPLGSCKMGRDPRTSVVGLDHQCHDVPGLYVVDGSTVPGPLGVNPQITIMGMATRAAAKIAERSGHHGAADGRGVA